MPFSSSPPANPNVSPSLPNSSKNPTPNSSAAPNCLFSVQPLPPPQATVSAQFPTTSPSSSSIPSVNSPPSTASLTVYLSAAHSWIPAVTTSSSLLLSAKSPSSALPWKISRPWPPASSNPEPRFRSQAPK